MDLLKEDNPLDKWFINDTWENNGNRYENALLKFNPFPKSGTAGKNTPDSITRFLKPYDGDVEKTLMEYIVQSLYAHGLEEAKDKFLSATITGDYGTGKTQLLLYAKYILNEVSNYRKPGIPHKKPFVVYIDNPGAKLSELIGQIISEIGEEDFRKFIWSIIIDGIKNSEEHKNTLADFLKKGNQELFPETDNNPYSDSNTVSYKKFLDVFIKYLSLRKRKELESALKDIILNILVDWKDSTIARYYYDFITEDYSVNKTWEILSKGSERMFDKKEVLLINSIIELVESQGYTDFYILVDEFEDLTEGRLSKGELDNYLRNLRTLIDHNKQWAVIFSMTDVALQRIESISPPLADRLANKRIQIKGFDSERAELIVKRYLTLARAEEVEDPIYPFTKEAIEYIRLNLSAANLRRFLRNCFNILEKFIISGVEGQIIDIEFIEKNIKVDNL